MSVVENNDSNKENVDAFRMSPVDEKTKEEPEETDEPVELTPEIKKALFESKLEIIVNENMKYNVKGVSPEELKRMLSVRVYPLKKVKEAATIAAEKVDDVVDFEEMLESCVVAKRNTFS